MNIHKSITIPVPAKAERKRNELFMQEKRFVEFARELRLQCDQGFLETYERRKVLFPCARVVWPRRLEERKHHYRISNDMRPFSMSTKSKEYGPYLEFAEIQSQINSGFGCLSPSHSGLIDAIIKKRSPDLSFTSW
jgi:hypothetical protein